MARLSITKAFIRRGVLLTALVIQTELGNGQVKRLSEDIVLINVGEVNRGVIARGLSKINSLGPKVTALDMIFVGFTIRENDDSLFSALNSCQGLVMGGLLTDYSVEKLHYKYFSELSAPEFLVNAKIGFINAIQENSGGNTLRRYSTYVNYKDEMLYHFSIQTAMAFDSVIARRFVSKSPRIVEAVVQKDLEFKRFTIQEVLQGGVSSNDIKGKIVMFGFLGPGNDDRFYSSINNGANEPGSYLYGLEFLARIVEEVIGTQ